MFFYLVFFVREFLGRPLARGRWTEKRLRAPLQGMLGGAGGTTNYFLSLHILSDA